VYRGRSAKVLGGIHPGDRLRVTKGSHTYTGILMPRSDLGDEDHIVLKLDSGYNIGIEVTGIHVEKIGEREAKRSPPPSPAPKPPTGPPVSLLGTGGTIASRIDYQTGAVHPSFSTEELIQSIPELGDLAPLRTRLLFNLLSENLTPRHWIEIAEACAEELNAGAQGVVVAHGTDTLGYTSAALSFLLKGLAKPVVLIGSQRSSDRPSSDAASNLLAAVRVAMSDIGEVTVVMHATSGDGVCAIHRGTKVRKMHSSRRDAFRSINLPPLGRVEGTRLETFLEYRKRGPGEVRVDGPLEEKVALIKVYPGIEGEVLHYHLDHYRGLILEGTGLGHVPEALLEPLHRASQEEIPVVMTTQTLHGRVDMKVYSTGRELLSRGVIPGGDMLPEVAYVKLMYLLGHGYSYPEIGEAMGTDLAGELSPVSRMDTF
jgi:glutamyl-tRNA(Gln) amidotransferase subunit D